MLSYRSLAALGLAGWVTYAVIWLLIRAHGSVTLEFGVWGPAWVHWFELWLEPVVIALWVAFLLWALRRQLDADARAKVRQGQQRTHSTDNELSMR